MGDKGIDIMTKYYIRISTEAADHIYEVETDEAALAAFARDAGYRDYAELARTLGKTVEEAKAELAIEHVTAADIVRDIADEALASDPSEDGADRFATAEDWADWCIKGRDGDAVRSLADLHGLDAAPLVRALRDILSERDLAAINVGFAPSETTIDTAIAAWKAAATQADRDLAAEAIEQHVAHQTPEGADYEAATAEVLARLEAECGPIPAEAGVYRDGTLLDGDAMLPHVFVHNDGAGTETRYWYQGQETFEVHVYDSDRRVWIGRGTNRYADDTTVDDFLVLQDVD